MAAHEEPDELEDLVLACFERLQERGEVAVEEFCREHPEHAPAIRGALRHLAKVGLVEPPLAEPTTFGGFRLLRRLGRGGMGVVHLAEQQGLGRRVALKLMRPGLHADARGRERFRREIEALSKVEHSGICPVYEAGEIGGVPYLAMRYVEGESLARILARRRAEASSSQERTPSTSGGRLVREAAHLVEKVARALHVAHEQGLVHRDVKPANILIDQQGEPVLVDFGLARDDAATGSLTALTATGEQVGTPAYMAPEQIRSDANAVDRRTDVYALGVVLYECLTLRRPFDAAARESLYRQILSEEPQPPRRLNHHVARELCVVLEKALQKDPARRFATALELAEELARFRLHEPIRTRRPGLALRARRWVQRNPTASGVLAATMLGLVSSLWFLLESELARRRLRALALVQKAGEVEGEDPELAFQLAREALRLDADPFIVARTQELAFDLREHVELEGADARLVHILWSPDGRHFVVTGDSAPAMLYRADGTLRTRALPRTPQHYPAAAFAPDGSELAIADEAGRVHRFVLAGEGLAERAAIDSGLPLAARVRYSPDGDRILVVAPDGGGLWSREGPRIARLTRRSPRPWYDGGFLPDGRVLAAGAVWDPAVRQRHDLPEQDTREESPVLTIGIGKSRFFTLSARGALRVYAHDGSLCWPCDLDVADLRGKPVHAELDAAERRILVAFQDGRISLFDVEGRRLEHEWRLRDSRSVVCARLAPDSERIVAGTWGGAVQIFDRHGQEIDVLKGHQGGVTWLAFSPGGERLVSTSVNGQVRIWTLGPRPGVSIFVGHGWAHVASSPDGARVVFASETGVLHLCDGSGRVVARQPTELARCFVAVTPDGGSAIVSELGRRVLLWSLLDPGRIETLPDSPEPLFGVPPQSLGDGSWLALTKSGLRRLQIGTAAEAAMDFLEPAPGNRVTAFCTSGDGSRVLLGRWLGDVLLVDREGREIRRAPRRKGIVNSVALSGDERQALVAGEDNCAHLWDLETGSEARFGPHQNGVARAVFSPDGSRIATAAKDGFARVFDRATGRCLLQARADRRGTIRCVAFTNTGQLVTSGIDGTVRWWWIDRQDLLPALDALRLPELSASERARFADLLGK